ncbi:MAG: hypothetical protein ABI217_04985 [Chthoniobacterales bacterium]
MKPGIFLRAILMASFLALPSFTRAEDGIQTFLEKTLAAVREKDHLPAVAALVQIDGKIEGEAALGFRALGHPEKVTTNDRGTSVPIPRPSRAHSSRASSTKE